MACVINRLSVFNHDHLRRFVTYLKIIRYLIAECAVFDEVEIMEIDMVRLLTFFQTTLCHRTHSAAGTMFKNDLWSLGRLLN